MMDIAALPGSRIVDIFRLALDRPDTDLLCVGQSDQASPRPARDALVAAPDAGETRYPDVRGLPRLHQALADHLSGLHANPVAESRIVVTAGGMAALTIAFAALIRPGQRVVMHSPAWPNVPDALTLRGAQVDALALTERPEGGFRLDLDRLAALLPGARAFVLNSRNTPTA